MGRATSWGFQRRRSLIHLRNTGSERLVYLMGGENRSFEVATFPKLGKKMIRNGSDIEIYDVADAKPFGPLG